MMKVREKLGVDEVNSLRGVWAGPRRLDDSDLPAKMKVRKILEGNIHDAGKISIEKKETTCEHDINNLQKVLEKNRKTQFVRL